MEHIDTKSILPPCCPSAQPEMAGSVVLGVVGGTVDEPRVAYLAEPPPVTDELLALSGPVKPTEIFRFAAPCTGNACQHFDGSNCRLATRIPRVVQRANLKKSGTHTIGMNSAPKRRGKNVHLIEKHQ